MSTADSRLYVLVTPSGFLSTVGTLGIDFMTGVKVFEELEGPAGARAMAKALGYAVVELPIVADFRGAGAGALAVVQTNGIAAGKVA